MGFNFPVAVGSATGCGASASAFTGCGWLNTRLGLLRCVGPDLIAEVGTVTARTKTETESNARWIRIVVSSFTPHRTLQMVAVAELVD